MDDDQLYKAIQASLVQARSQAGLTQAALARASGIKRSTIAMVEARKQRPTLVHVWRIAGAIGVTLDELLPSAAPSAAPAGATVTATLYEQFLEADDGSED